MSHKGLALFRQGISHLLLGYLIYAPGKEIFAATNFLLLPKPPQLVVPGLLRWLPLLFPLSFALVFVFEYLWILSRGKSFKDGSFYQLFHYRETREMDQFFWFINKGNVLPSIWSGAGILAATKLSHKLSDIGVIGFFEWMPEAEPLKVGLSIILVSFLSYCLHRIWHVVPELWELHKIHHSATEMTCLTVFREHPILDVLSNFTRTFAFLVLGLPPMLAVPVIIFQNIQTGLTHSKCQATWGWLGKVLTSPMAHWIHHSKDPKYHNLNFGTDFIVWDRLFGTYKPPKDFLQDQGRTPISIGLNTYEFEKKHFVVALILSVKKSVCVWLHRWRI